MENVKSKYDYIKADIKIYNSLEHEVIESTGKIKGRGNYSWREYPKKPYKIKFSEKQSPFGFPENKDWVLLAEYCDKSLLRTAYMCEVSKEKNNERWPQFGNLPNIKFDRRDEEVNYMRSYYSDRLSWLDSTLLD